MFTKKLYNTAGVGRTLTDDGKPIILPEDDTRPYIPYKIEYSQRFFYVAMPRGFSTIIHEICESISVGYDVSDNRIQYHMLYGNGDF
jgi:hypothetical protein